MGLIPTYLLIFAGVLIFGVAVIWLLQQRRSPQSALAWLIFMFSVPYLGVPLFFAIGTRKRGARYEMIEFAPGGAPDPVHPVDAALRGLGTPAAEAGHALALLTDPEASRAAVEALIDNSETRIDVTLYRLEPDAIGRDFIARLIRAVERGVRVRMILDQVGTWNRPRAALRDLRAAGGDVRLFSALPQLSTTGRMNLRNHRKMLIADGARVWSGGQNVGAPYLGPAADPDTWRDLSFTLAGPAVRRFSELFAADWAKVSGEAPGPVRAPEPAGRSIVQVIPSGPDVDHDALHDELVHAIHQARRRVWIATPYFLPTEQLRHALVTQARLGLDLRLLVPSTSNQPLADFARGAYLRDIGEAGGRVLRFTPGMMHAKAVLVDDMALVGSANLDVRSMLLNFEVMLALYSPHDVAVLERWFTGLEARSVEGLRDARLPRRLAEAVFRLGTPIL